MSTSTKKSTSKGKPSAYIVIPTYNEATNIENAIDQLFAEQKNIKNNELHVVVTDGNSPDGTADIVKGLQSKYKNLHLVQGPKGGLGGDYRRAFKHIIENTDASYIGMFDGDLSHDPKQLYRMLDAVNGDFDVAIGSRRCPDSFIPGDWPMLRILNTRVSNWIARNIGGINTIGDITAGYRVMRRAVAEDVISRPPGPSKGYVFQVYLSNLFQEHYRVVEKPISFRDRVEGDSKIRISDITEFVKYCVVLRLRKTPAVLLASFLLVVIAALLAYFATCYFTLALLGLMGVQFIYLLILKLKNK